MTGVFGARAVGLLLALGVWSGGAAMAQSVPVSGPVTDAPSGTGPSVRLPNEWRVTKDRWTDADERAFSDFVQRIGDSGCNSVNKCMTSDANPYRATNPPGAFFGADCADFPYFLRTYFAWKNGLPFSFISAVSPKGSTNDIRYTLSGNRIVSRRDLLTGSGSGTSILGSIRGVVSSATFRLHPMDEDTDLYPVAIQPKSVRPGTVVYDPNGHLIVVYRVEKDGRARYIDSHPDNSVTRGTYGQKFVRARPGMGAGFKNWRPLRLVDYVKRADGVLIGGRIVFAKNAEIPDYSWEQFYGTDVKDPKDANWASGKFTIAGENYEYYDWVRTRLAGGSLSYEPVVELRNMMRANCEDIKYRAEAVDLAIKAGIHLKSQISRLPNNIYGTDGEWEEFSTPSRDARLKTSFKELRDQTERLVVDHRAGSKRIIYQGANLAADLIKAYDEEASACQITYTRSDGAPQTLGYEDVRRRMFLLSFDPYHCIERRWGATEGAEAAACKDGAEKTAWYKAEQRLRNQIERTYDARMDHDLATLQAGKAPGTGVDAPPDIDLRGWLTRELANPTPPPPVTGKPVSSTVDPAAPRPAARTAKPAPAPVAATPKPPEAQAPARPRAEPVRDTTIGRDSDGVGSKVPRDKWDHPLDAPYSPTKAGEGSQAKPPSSAQ